MKFVETGIHPDLIKAATEAGFEDLTPIQVQCLELGLQGKDIAGISQTGTGKTVAFLLPILHRILTNRPEGPSALIVTPTRELCYQIKEEAEKLTRHSPIQVTAIYGGEGYGRQEEELSRNPDLIVATPGRLIDYLKQNKVELSRLQALVLDEADRMFDMGFIRDIRFIMRKAPADAQNMLFSATLSYYVMRLASDFMKDPVRVEIESESVAVDRIEQKLFHLGRNEKMPYLVHSILSSEGARVIVFTNTKFMVQKIQDHLRKFGIAATGLSSLLDQKKRMRLLKDFKLGRYSVLVATDVASRGIDIDDISHVYNYDVPQDGESYVHRIGRTARAGRTGISITFCSEDDYENLPRVHRYLNDRIAVGEVNSEWTSFPRGEFTFFREPAEERTRDSESESEGRKDGRRSRGGRRRDGRDRRKENVEENVASSTSSEEQKASHPDREQHEHGEEHADRPRKSRRRRRKSKKTVSEFPVTAFSEDSASVETALSKGESTASSVRSQDRAAILSGINTRAGGARPAEPLSEEMERKGRRKRSGSGRNGRDRERDRDTRDRSRSGGESRNRQGRRSRGDGQENWEGRERRPREQRGSSGRNRRNEIATPAQKKAGVLSRILSMFRQK